MAMDEKKKSGLELLVGAPDGEDEDMDDEGDGDEESKGSEKLCEEAFDAVKDDDREGFCAAMKALLKGRG